MRLPAWPPCCGPRGTPQSSWGDIEDVVTCMAAMLRSAWHATVQLGLSRICGYLHGRHVAVRVARH
eukprot:359805-Pyramimonas_sp.AAC.1